MKNAYLPDSAPNGFLEVSRGYDFGSRVRARLAEKISSVSSGKGDIEFP
jgi:hypothetical protein